VPRTDDLGELDGGLGVSVSPVNIEKGMRLNTAIMYLDPVRNRPNLRVVGEVLIDHVTLTRGRADGIVAIVDGKQVTVRGDLIVLSSGAYGTPAILLRSGIGAASRLEELGIRPLVNLPGVGRVLQDQPTALLTFRGSPELERRLADHVRPTASCRRSSASPRCRADWPATMPPSTPTSSRGSSPSRMAGDASCPSRCSPPVPLGGWRSPVPTRERHRRSTTGT
jgi:choline dehydrogenase-like flavoprotein